MSSNWKANHLQEMAQVLDSYISSMALVMGEGNACFWAVILAPESETLRHVRLGACSPATGNDTKFGHKLILRELRDGKT